MRHRVHDVSGADYSKIERKSSGCQLAMGPEQNVQDEVRNVSGASGAEKDQARTIHDASEAEYAGCRHEMSRDASGAGIFKDEARIQSRCERGRNIQDDETGIFKMTHKKVQDAKWGRRNLQDEAHNVHDASGLSKMRGGTIQEASEAGIFKMRHDMHPR